MEIYFTHVPMNRVDIRFHRFHTVGVGQCFFRKLNSNSLRRSWVNYAFGASSVGVGIYQVPCAGLFPFEKYLKNRFLSFFVGTYTYCMESYVHRWIEHRSSSSTSFLLFFALAKGYKQKKDRNGESYRFTAISNACRSTGPQGGLVYGTAPVP